MKDVDEDEMEAILQEVDAKSFDTEKAKVQWRWFQRAVRRDTGWVCR